MEALLVFPKLDVPLTQRLNFGDGLGACSMTHRSLVSCLPCPLFDVQLMIKYKLHPGS